MGDAADDTSWGALKVIGGRRPADGWHVVELVGRLDIETTGRFDHGMQEAIARRPGRIVVDLRRVTHIDSSGIRALILAQRAATAEAVEVCLLPGSSHVRRILRTTGVAGHFRLLDDPEDPRGRPG
jgi:anti-sigma B factor antagonist